MGDRHSIAERPIIRSAAWVAFAAVAAIAVAACSPSSLLPSARPSPGAPHLIASPGPSPSPQLLAVWALWPLGINLHQDADPGSPRTGTVAQATELDVTGQRTVAGQTWLKVGAHDSSGLQGWVLDSPDLVTHQAVSLHIDSQSGWSAVFPSGWTVESPPNGYGITSFTGSGGEFDVNLSAAAPTAPPTPPGQDLREQQVEVYGKTTFFAVYQLAGGSFEQVARVTWDPQRYFVISYRQPPALAADRALFTQLLTGIKIT